MWRTPQENFVVIWSPDLRTFFCSAFLPRFRDRIGSVCLSSWSGHLIHFSDWSDQLAMSTGSQTVGRTYGVGYGNKRHCSVCRTICTLLASVCGAVCYDKMVLVLLAGCTNLGPCNTRSTCRPVCTVCLSGCGPVTPCAEIASYGAFYGWDGFNEHR